MKYEVGEKLYNAGGNGEFFSFAHAEVVRIASNHYEVKVLRDFGCVWGEKDHNKDPTGTVISALEPHLFHTYEEAIKSLYSEMHFENEHDHIRYIFKRGR